MRCLLLLLAAVAFGADLPPDALQAMTVYDKACAEAQAKADAVKTEAAKRLLPLLDASMKKATQKGDLESAMAVKAKREEVETAVRASMLALAPPVAPDKIAGAWVVESGTGIGSNFTFTRDGKWVSPWPGFSGTWVMENGALVMTSVDGRPCQASLTGDRTMTIKANVTCMLKKQGR